MSRFIQIDATTSLHRNNSLQLLCFFLEKNREIYAINVFKVREVIKYDGEISQLDFQDCSLVEGLIVIRGTTMPLIDMRKWLHYDSKNPQKSLVQYTIEPKNSHYTIMICEFSNLTIGIKIYEVDRILDKKWEQIQQGVDVIGGAYNNKLTSHTRYFDNRLVQIIDMEKMLIDVFPWLDQAKNQEFKQLKSLSYHKLVLIADDSPTALKTLAKILNTLGLKHKDFMNGQSLLDYVFSRQDEEFSEIGLIITDLEMPETSGFEVIRQIKSHAKTAHIPIIVNSSMSSDSNKQMALSLKADGFISKSSPLVIKTVVQNLVNS